MIQDGQQRSDLFGINGNEDNLEIKCYVTKCIQFHLFPSPTF